MSDSSRNGGIGLCGAMFIVFLVLKLTGEIDWSWYAVTAPLWVPAASVLAICAIIFAIFWPIVKISDVLKRRRYLAKKRERDGVPKL